MRGQKRFCYLIYTRLYIVAQCDNVSNDFVNDVTRQYLYAISFK